MEENLLNQIKVFFELKANQYGIALAFLYGSWARGIPRPDSDVDLAVVFSRKTKTLSNEQIFDAIGALTIDLTRTIKKEVNIIPILADFKKPMLYYNAIVLGQPVYIESTDDYARFFVAAIFQMEDFSIFGTKWQLQAAAKNLEGIKKHDRI